MSNCPYQGKRITSAQIANILTGLTNGVKAMSLAFQEGVANSTITKIKQDNPLFFYKPKDS